MVIETGFSEYKFTATTDDECGVLFVELEYYNKALGTTSFKTYDTIAEVDQFIEHNEKKQKLISIIEGMESIIKGYYGDDVNCITDDSYEGLAEVIIDKLGELK